MGKSIKEYIRRNILQMEAYTPIVPLEELSEHSGLPVEGIIKLDGNENPYGCSPVVRQALGGYKYYHIYPDPEQKEVRKALEGYTGVSPDYIVAGSGSDELIEMIVRLFLEPADKIINCVPTFGMYSFLAEVYGGQVVTIRRKPDFSVDLETVLKAVDEKTKIIFLASPNNPSGNTVGRDELLKLLESGLLVVVDEAYYEFSKKSFIDMVSQHERLMVLRTFSKWAGLAGLRAGYGVFPKEIVPFLMKTKQPYNINAAAQVAVVESLKDLDYLQKTVDKIIEERGRMLSELQKLPFLRPFPSEANFILCRVVQGDAKTIYKRLQKKGIFIRYFDTPLLKDYIRISVGKPEHTPRVIEALKKAVEGKDG